MRELDEVRELRGILNSIDERKEELRHTMFSGVQTLSDMPRGGGEPKNAIEEYVIKAERLDKRHKNYVCKIVRKWNALKERFEAAELTEAQQNMLLNRFYYGYSWKRCVREMEKTYPDAKWNEQKLFHMYRKILHKLTTKKSQNFGKIAN